MPLISFSTSGSLVDRLSCTEFFFFRFSLFGVWLRLLFRVWLLLAFRCFLRFLCVKFRSSNAWQSAFLPSSGWTSDRRFTLRSTQITFGIQDVMAYVVHYRGTPDL